MFGKLVDNYKVQKEKHMNRKLVVFEMGLKVAFCLVWAILLS